MTRAHRLLLVGAVVAGCAACGGSVGAAPTPSVAGRTTAGAPTAATGTDSPSGSDVASPPVGAVPVPGGLAGTAPVVDPAMRPVHLAVPSIGVDTSLIALGIDPSGALEVPSDYAQAGWFDRSPAPGERGPAVLAGHIDSTSGPAVFYRLRELAQGARITVTRADGAVVGFTVDGVQQYPKDAFPTSAVYGPVPGPVLRLITCGGAFDRSSGHYRDNVVVYATAVGA